MTLTSNQTLGLPQVVGIVQATNTIEPGANETEALPLLIQNVSDFSEWEYSATAEDKGTAGSLDLQPGLIYKGPPGQYVTVKLRDVDIAKSSISSTSPEAADSATLVITKNSAPAAECDEGFVNELDAVTAEFNLDGVVGPLVTNDVLRVTVQWTGEEADADLGLAQSAVIILS